MKKFLSKSLFAVLLLGLCSLQADTPPPSDFMMPLETKKAPVEKAIQLKIEMHEDTNGGNYGLTKPAIYNEISTRLSLAAIKMKEGQGVPQLILRVKTIQADRAVATFVQLGFFEDAILNRNQSTVQALTWSQATMLSCAKEDVVKEVMPVITQMTNSFILEYQKAMQ